MGLTHSYKRIYKKSIGTSNVEIEENPKRIGLLIQNLSGNTLYVKSKYQQDNGAAIEINGFNPYSDEVGASAALSLQASAANSDIRIEEIIKI